MKTTPRPTTKFTSGGTTIEAEHTTPAAPNGGVIVLAHGSEGMTDNISGPWGKMIREYADELSKLGFVTLTPFYFQKTGTDPVKVSADFKVKNFGQIIAGRLAWMAVLADAVAHAKTLSSVQPARVGLLGFSLGGNLCLEIRELAKVLVAFYAPLPELSPRGGRLALQAQLHNGTADELVPSETAHHIEEMLKKEGATVDLKTYWKGKPGAVHGFIGTDAANTQAQADSKASTLSFFLSPAPR
jgi:dienelactone hydrolase